MDRLRNMNPEQMGSLLRTFGQVIGAALAMWGFMSNETWATISGPLGTLLLTAWGLWARNDKNLIASAMAVPAVAKVKLVEPEVTATVRRSMPHMAAKVSTMKPLAFVALALLLVGCITPQTPAVLTPSSATELLPANVQGWIQTGCGVVVDTSTAQAIAGKFIPGVETVSTFLQSICNSLVVRRAGRGGAKVAVGNFRGVRIVGRRLAG